MQKIQNSDAFSFGNVSDTESLNGYTFSFGDPSDLESNSGPVKSYIKENHKKTGHRFQSIKNKFNSKFNIQHSTLKKINDDVVEYNEKNTNNPGQIIRKKIKENPNENKSNKKPIIVIIPPPRPEYSAINQNPPEPFEKHVNQLSGLMVVSKQERENNELYDEICENNPKILSNDKNTKRLEWKKIITEYIRINPEMIENFMTMKESKIFFNLESKTGKEFLKYFFNQAPEILAYLGDDIENFLFGERNTTLNRYAIYVAVRDMLKENKIDEEFSIYPISEINNRQEVINEKINRKITFLQKVIQEKPDIDETTKIRTENLINNGKKLIKSFENQIKEYKKLPITHAILVFEYLKFKAEYSAIKKQKPNQ